MTMITAALFMSVLVMKVYMVEDNKPLPRWLHWLVNSCLRPNFCDRVQKSKKKDQDKQMQDVETRIDNNNDSSDKTSDMKVKVDEEQVTKKNASDAEDLQELPVSFGPEWKMAALLLDKIIFYIYIMAIIILTAIFLFTILETNPGARDM